ncbi:hypothtical protein [Weissella oryzae SG25]|uniref:Hypothtical protein n=1 Tax=Weissella oryzae (strain DSM 25784 / JCM 18191 / LMG 30913 / SG25) TaxID=1329250 RepID=A0A069CT06_WEIOS|nr:YueI family protein [Weissella oryzae]GAK30537.1 hypothtical protein [Weissella oryzae SG25]
MSELEGLDPHLQNGIYGKKQLNPDEKRHYLGTFRERVYMTQTVATFGQADYLPLWERSLLDHEDATLLINGNLPIDLVNKYIKLASYYGVAFTLVTDAAYHTEPKDLAVVLTAHEAVNIKDIAIEDQVKLVEETKAPSKKAHWYDRLFGK